MHDLLKAFVIGLTVCLGCAAFAGDVDDAALAKLEQRIRSGEIPASTASSSYTTAKRSRNGTCLGRTR